MSFLYPDNQHRYDRVSGLASNIGEIQQEVKDAIDRTDAVDVRINQTFNTLLAQHNMTTVAELQEKVLASLTPEQKKHYEDMVAEFKGHDAVVDKIFDATLMVGFIGGGSLLIAQKLTVLLDTGALIAGATLVGRGFVRILRGAFAEGAALIRAGIRTGRLLAAGVPLTANAARFVRVFRAGFRVLAAVSVLLDGVLLIYQAVEGAKQRTELQKGILELFSRRQNVKNLEQQVFAVESFQGSVQGYLYTASILPPGPERDATLKQFADSIISSTQNALSLITDDSVYNTLKSQDTGSSAWTNEDPTLQQALDWIAAQPDQD